MNKDSVLLTEDGFPIGDVVLADGDNLDPVRTTADAVSDARSELTRAGAQELSGGLDEDDSIVDLYPGYTDADKRRDARKMFLVDSASISEISEKVGVPQRTVSQWMFVDRWDVLAKRDIAAHRSQSLLELERLRSKRRLEIANEQLSQAKKIRDKALDNIKAESGSLKANTEAWAAAAKVEHTITGVSEAGTIATADDAPDKNGTGKQPLVMVFQGGLPPIRKANQ